MPTALVIAVLLTALGLAPPGGAAAPEVQAASSSATGQAPTSASGTAPAPAAPAAQADPPLSPAEEVDGCLGCHGMKSLDVQLPGGETLSLFVDQAAYSTSTHKKLACSDCHGEMKGVEGEHPKRPLATRRAFASAYSAACKKCHFQNFTDAQASVHQAQLAVGKLAAAVCSDCHGAHDITPPARPRSRISRTCATCHQEVAAAYGRSVHGKALLSGENGDVPACTDCHRSHDIADPRTGSMRVRTPDLCGSCHTNERVMAKYNLSTKVLQTYLSDFHGVTARFQQGAQGKSPVVAVCTDCHGVHDITRVKSPDSKVLQENLLTTCRKCHPDAKADFPASWMSHYEPSLEKTPLVYLVKVFYQFVIPFMIGGLALQILLHLWRLVVNR